MHRALHWAVGALIAGGDLARFCVPIEAVERPETAQRVAFVDATAGRPLLASALAVQGVGQ